LRLRRLSGSTAVYAQLGAELRHLLIFELRPSLLQCESPYCQW
jgi:hypothetical protein